MQQANVHCAYCNLTYEQSEDSCLKLQVHQCWLFYPWHRWYLYFYERILGKLIDDPSFGLPFWNWDNRDGMVMPDMFVVKDSSLYDPRRNQDHLPPATVDLKYDGKPTTESSDTIKDNNVIEMYREMVTCATTLEGFYGAKYVTGSCPDPGAGSVEGGSHTAVHRWVGQNTQEGLDMGNFSTASRDPIFFAHHGNVDRLWSIWQERGGSKWTEKYFRHADFLDANFLFYDENAQLVRVRVRDALDHKKMGYIYQEVDNPWLEYKRERRDKPKINAGPSDVPEIIFPVILNKVVQVLVDRPKKSRSNMEKEKEEELLVIEGIEVDSAKFLRFEVYVNDKADASLDTAMYAGCYSQVPTKKSAKIRTKIRVGLTELIEDLNVEDDDKILVSLVPKAGGEGISIGRIKIIYAS
ncbi:Polyphenol oxidase I, chloroplastic [Sesamum alatum]|uniref:Polyphenol oxidase I, chloroplastic n=1 Tax=Sesamum alatum TaxID=300844 RepID=A0AAE2CY88_9LAMI|nr:Polyphenol oxidase I, chloroplastic [Sesamum alatum]